MNVCGRGCRLKLQARTIDDLVLTLAPGADLAGVVKLEGSSDTNPPGLRVFLQPDSRIRGSGAPVRAGGAFMLANVMPDRYRIDVYGLPDTSYLKSIFFGSADVSQTGLDFTHGVSPGELVVTVAATAAHVEGTVQDRQGQPAPNVRVVAFPTSRPTSRILRPA